MKKWLIGLTLLAVVAVGALIVARPAAEPPMEPPMTEVAPAPMAPSSAVPSKDLAAVEEKKAALEQELAAARHELTELRMQAATTPAATATNPAPDKPASFMDAIASMMDSPDMQEMMKVQARMGLEQTHGEFLRGIDLTEDEAVQLKDLLVTRNLSMMSTGLRHMKGEAMDGEDTKATLDAFNAQIKELLGDDGYALFERYEETQPERMQVDLFKERLSGDLALDWETQDRLIGALADARMNAPQNPAMDTMSNGGAMPTPEMMHSALEYMESVNERYLEEAATILNQEQYDVFQQSLEQYATMQKAGIKMAEAMFGGGEGQDTPNGEMPKPE